MKKVFNIYQYVVPLILFPITFLLWRNRIDDNKSLFLILSIPIITAYIIPAIGTNYLKLWEFKAKFMVGKFRIQHGFLFGTFTAFFAFCFINIHREYNFLSILQTGMSFGAILGFWNWVYDIYAIKSGMMIVYTKKYYEGKTAEAIATDYAPVYFGVFGFIYGIEIALIKILEKSFYNNWVYMITSLIFYIIALTIPTLCYIVFSYIRYKDFGLKPYKLRKDKI